MCNSQNQVIVDSVISEFISQRKPFTAFDVTQESRKRGATEFHGQMKASVHGKWAAMQSDNYQRQIIYLNGSPVDPWLYFPQGYDPMDYVNAINAGNPITVATASPVHPHGISQPDADSGDSVEDEDDVNTNDFATGILTSEDRLAVPKEMLRQIGAYTHNTVHVIAIPGDNKVQVRLDLGTSGVDPNNHATEYDTGARLEIRISKEVMEKANISGPTFRIKKLNDSIEITA